MEVVFRIIQQMSAAGWMQANIKVPNKTKYNHENGIFVSLCAFQKPNL
jgi:hypothetical protein